jgi:hypothetical protein
LGILTAGSVSAFILGKVGERLPPRKEHEGGDGGDFVGREGARYWSKGMERRM